MRQFNVVYPVEWAKDGKKGTRWPTIGRAFEGNRGITLQLDAIPINFDGKLMLFEIDEGKLTRPPGGPPPQGGPPEPEDVPF